MLCPDVTYAVDWVLKPIIYLSVSAVQTEKTLNALVYMGYILNALVYMGYIWLSHFECMCTCNVHSVSMFNLLAHFSCASEKQQQQQKIEIFEDVVLNF